MPMTSSRDKHGHMCGRVTLPKADVCLVRQPVRVLVVGAHINPAVTVALAVIGKFPWRKVPHYLLGQYIGAFVAATIVYGVYYGKTLNNYFLGTF